MGLKAFAIFLFFNSLPVYPYLPAVGSTFHFHTLHTLITIMGGGLIVAVVTIAVTIYSRTNQYINLL